MHEVYSFHDGTSIRNGTSPLFTISLFPNKTSTRPREIAEAWPQLVERFSRPTVRADKGGPLWSPATFKAACRKKENVEALGLLVLDVDGGMTIAEAETIIRTLGVQACIYSTHSHQRSTPDHQQPADRFRIVIALAEPISAKDFPRLWQWISEQFGGRIDASCKDASRMYYLPAIASKGAPFEFKNFIGQPLAWRALNLPDDDQAAGINNPGPPLDPPAGAVRTPEAYLDAAVAGEIERLEIAPIRERNNTLNKSVYNLARLGVDRATIESALIPVAERIRLTKQEIKATFRSAYNAGMKKPRIISSTKGSTMSQTQTKKPTSNNGAAGASSSQAKQTSTSSQGNGAGTRGAKQSSGNAAGAQTQGQANSSGATAQGTPNAGKQINHQPITRVIKGVEFTADNTGVWAGKVGKKKSKISSPLFIEVDTRNARGEGWGRLLVFYDREGREKVWVMPYSWLAGNRTKYREKLLDMGLWLAPGRQAATWLHFYLHDQPADVALSVDRVGWADDAFVLPDQTISAQAGERIYLQSSGVNNLLKTSGTLNQWQQSVGQYCTGNSRLMFGVSAAFAAPLLTPFGISGGGFHLMGGSSFGKSTTQYVAGSVWGGGGKHGYVESWNASSTGVEYLSEYHNDNFLPLDEIALANPKEIGQSVYMIINGCGKTRGQAEGGLRKQSVWTVMALSSGEKTLREYMAEADQKIMDGQEVRLIHLPADAGAGLGVFEDLHGFKTGKEFSDYLRREAKRYYGTPIRAFLDHLISQQLVVTSRQRFETYKNKFIEDNLGDKTDKLAGRAADLFAVVGFAGELASEWSTTGWPVDGATKAAATLYGEWLKARGAVGHSEEEQAIAVVRAFLEKHGSSRFQRRQNNGKTTAQTVINRAGYVDINAKGEIDFYYILPEAFRTDVCAGFNHTTVLNALKAKGYLKVGSDRDQIQIRGVPEGRPYVYAILAQIHE
jgi:uncharacterized protein (DUF927 family)